MRIENFKIDNKKSDFLGLKISLFFNYVFPVYILKGIFFSLLRYFLKNQLVTKIIFVTFSLPASKLRY